MNFVADDGYYEDMYPEAEEKPLQRPDTALSLGLFSDAGLDDELALEEAEEWTRHHPLSAGIANQGFEVSLFIFSLSSSVSWCLVVKSRIDQYTRTGLNPLKTVYR